MFCQGGPVDNFTHVLGPVAKYSAESDYNAACTSGMALAHFRIINNELKNKDPDVVPEQAPLIILDSKNNLCMAKNVKDTKKTRQNFIRMHLVINGEDCNLHKTVYREGGLKLADIGTNTVREEKLNTRLEYTMARLDN